MDAMGKKEPIVYTTFCSVYIVSKNLLSFRRNRGIWHRDGNNPKGQVFMVNWLLHPVAFLGEFHGIASLFARDRFPPSKRICIVYIHKQLNATLPMHP